MNSIALSSIVLVLTLAGCIMGSGNSVDVAIEVDVYADDPALPTELPTDDDVDASILAEIPEEPDASTEEMPNDGYADAGVDDTAAADASVDDAGSDASVTPNADTIS